MAHYAYDMAHSRHLPAATSQPPPSCEVQGGRRGGKVRGTRCERRACVERRSCMASQASEQRAATGGLSPRSWERRTDSGQSSAITTALSVLEAVKYQHTSPDMSSSASLLVARACDVRACHVRACHVRACHVSICLAACSRARAYAAARMLRLSLTWSDCSTV